jgi:hypothetical protein
MCPTVTHALSRESTNALIDECSSLCPDALFEPNHYCHHYIVCTIGLLCAQSVPPGRPRAVRCCAATVPLNNLVSFETLESSFVTLFQANARRSAAATAASCAKCQSASSRTAVRSHAPALAS